MSENCTHDCSSCGESCTERQKPEDLRETCHPLARVGKVVAVVSGKGGVGKSMVTSLLAVLMQRRGYQAGILDADVTGPSIPRAFKAYTGPGGSDEGLIPARTKTGIQFMSCNLLLEHDTDPVIWRGPIIAGMVKQFWTDVIWQDVDYLFVDLPPGTGDVPLTVFQSLPVDAAVVVTSPQSLVGMIVEKAVNMARMMHVPVAALVENYSYVKCPGCGEEFSPFGKSGVQELAEKLGVPLTARLPIEPKLAAAFDDGMTELFEGPWLDELANAIEKL
ncbi:MAG: Mrp/NBP35 family ATP-binding protein [Clostridiaceae bacterium]|nr:Mrp/NBP35 family ATP-binding protein [Clostridiaceae bacterium]